MKKLLLVLSLISVTITVQAQSEEVFRAPVSDMISVDDLPELPEGLVVILESQIIKDQKIVKVNVDNLITMMNMSTLEWEKSMKVFKGDRIIKHSCVSYYIDFGNMKQIVQKCQEGVVVEWKDIEGKSSIMDTLYYDLEPYYMGKNPEGSPAYGFIDDGVSYQFILNRDSGREFVWVTKTPK